MSFFVFYHGCLPLKKSAAHAPFGDALLAYHSIWEWVELDTGAFDSSMPLPFVHYHDHDWQ
jgi:hypothetical protein